MVSNSIRTERRRRLKLKKQGKERKRKQRKNPPQTLPLDEAPSGAEKRSK